MNYIPNIPTTSVFSASLSQMVYLYLLSFGHVDKESGVVTCEKNYPQIQEVFGRNHTENAFEAAIEELEKNHLITVRKEQIIIGENKRLFAGVEENLESEFEYLITTCKSYLETARGGTYKRILHLLDELEDLYTDREYINKWSAKELVNLFRYSFEVTYQDTFPEPQAKEFGQVKLLLKRYDNVTLARMIVHFIRNSEDYGKAIPNVGLFCSITDKVYAAVKGLSKAKGDVRRTTDIKARF